MSSWPANEDVFLLYISGSTAVLPVRFDSKQADVTVMGGLCRATPPFIPTYRLKRESPPLPAPLSSLWANQKLILLED